MGPPNARNPVILTFLLSLIIIYNPGVLHQSPHMKRRLQLNVFVRYCADLTKVRGVSRGEVISSPGRSNLNNLNKLEQLPTEIKGAILWVT
jgi:hypothetical protein